MKIDALMIKSEVCQKRITETGTGRIKGKSACIPCYEEETH